MTRSARSVALYGACLASLLLAACGKHPTPPPADQPATPSTAATATATKPAAATIAKTTTTAPPPPASSTTAQAAAPAIAATSTATSATISVASVTLGNTVNADHQVAQTSNRFAPDDKIIYASVATAGSTGNATLNAQWSYLEGPGKLISSISQAIATDGPAVTTFMVRNPDLWPEGKYKVEISLDGKSVATQNFEIARH